MGIDISKLGDFGRLPSDLRKPVFVKKYLPKSDIKLLLIAYGIKIKIKSNDVFYYIRVGYGNLNLHKYFDFKKFLPIMNYNNLASIKFVHMNGVVLTDENFSRGLTRIEIAKYLCENNIDIPKKCLNRTIAVGDIDVIRYLYWAGCVFDLSSFVKMLERRIEVFTGNPGYFCAYMHDPVAHFLFENVTLPTYDGVFMMALMYADYYIIKLMLGRFIEPNDVYYSIFKFSDNITGQSRRHIDYLQKYCSVSLNDFKLLLST